MNLMQILTNENPVVINIISVAIIVIQTALFHRIFTKVLNIPTTRIKKYLFIAVSSIFPIIGLFIPNSLLNDCMTAVSFFLLLHYMFKQNTKNSILAIFISYFCAIVAESVVNFAYIYLLKLDPNLLLKRPLYLLGVQTLGSLLLFFVPNVIELFILRFKKLKNKIKISPKILILLNFIFGFITMVLETYLFSVYRYFVPIQLTISIIVSTLLYFSITMYSLMRTSNLEKTEENLRNEKIYNKTLTILHDNIRGFKHDFNNIVQAIGGYVVLNDMVGLKKYYQRLLDECKLNNNLNLLNPETINNPSIYSLLTNKYFLANSKNITMNFSMFSDLSKLTNNTYEISRILGILLDNAIEAAEETEDKIINIEIKSDDKKHIFTIKNSCKDTNISTTKIFEKGYSTKNRNSGFGLWNVHKILSKNTNLDLYTTIENDMFCQQFTIYY